MKTRAAVCIALAAAFAATAASAETLIKVRNTSEQPATVTIDKKSRDIRARKTYNFPLEAPTAPLKVEFANGDVNYGEIDIAPFFAVENPEDGNTYFCMTVDTEDFNILPRETCAEWLKK